MDAPRWLTRLTAAALGLIWWVGFVVTFLAWAWRATHPGWVWPALLALELALIGFCVTYGRRFFARAVGFAWARLRRPRIGLPAAAVVVLALVWASWPQSFGERAGEPPARRSVGVVGAGAAGLHAAWMLHQGGVDFTVFEATETIGGHAFSPDFETDQGSFPVDIGFIFGGIVGYQEMKALMATYDVPRTKSVLSMSVRVGDNVWATDAPDTLHPEALRFQELAAQLHEDLSLDLVPFGWWLAFNGFDGEFRRDYLTPLLSVLFITKEGIYEYSTRFVLSMFAGPRRWVDFRNGGDAWVIGGGSKAYYRELTADFSDRIVLNSPVISVERFEGRVKITHTNLSGERKEVWFDEVILAVPADVAHAILRDKSGLEAYVLGQVRYFPSQLVLHQDQSLLPDDESIRRNYNYHQAEGSEELELTGMMGRTLGGGTVYTPEPLGTLNPQRPIKNPLLERVWRHHPQDMWHLAHTTELLTRLQGRGHVWYAGDWVTFIGHGPAIRTGIRAACEAGGVLDHDPTVPTGIKPDEFVEAAKKSVYGVERPDQPCVDAMVADPRDGNDGATVTLCGELGAYEFVTELACPGFSIPEKGHARAP